MPSNFVYLLIGRGPHSSVFLTAHTSLQNSKRVNTLNGVVVRFSTEIAVYLEDGIRVRPIVIHSNQRPTLIFGTPNIHPRRMTQSNQILQGNKRRATFYGVHDTQTLGVGLWWGQIFFANPLCTLVLFDVDECLGAICLGKLTFSVCAGKLALRSSLVASCNATAIVQQCLSVLVHPADDVTLSNSPPTHLPPAQCSPLSPSITHSRFHSRLKIQLFHKSFPP